MGWVVWQGQDFHQGVLGGVGWGEWRRHRARRRAHTGHPTAQACRTLHHTPRKQQHQHVCEWVCLLVCVLSLSLSFLLLSVSLSLQLCRRPLCCVCGCCGSRCMAFISNRHHFVLRGPVTSSSQHAMWGVEEEGGLALLGREGCGWGGGNTNTAPSCCTLGRCSGDGGQGLGGWVAIHCMHCTAFLQGRRDPRGHRDMPPHSNSRQDKREGKTTPTPTHTHTRRRSLTPLFGWISKCARTYNRCQGSCSTSGWPQNIATTACHRHPTTATDLCWRTCACVC